MDHKQKCKNKCSMINCEARCCRYSDEEHNCKCMDHLNDLNTIKEVPHSEDTFKSQIINTNSNNNQIYTDGRVSIENNLKYNSDDKKSNEKSNLNYEEIEEKNEDEFRRENDESLKSHYDSQLINREISQNREKRERNVEDDNYCIRLKDGDKKNTKSKCHQ